MCGVIGIIYKNTKELGLAPVGGDLIKMLTALEHRGKDSTGVTISGLDTQEDYIIRCRVDNKKSSIADLSLTLINTRETVRRSKFCFSDCMIITMTYVLSGSFLRNSPGISLTR